MTPGLIEVPLNSFRYHFRRLTWQEEIALSPAKNEDGRKVLLAKALVDVSGMPVTRQDARRIFDSLPEALFWRIWLVYRGNLPPERYYTSGGLYEAPDPMAYTKKIEAQNNAVEAAADAASAHLENKFGTAGVREAEDISRQMFQQAQRAGTLVPTREDARG